MRFVFGVLALLGGLSLFGHFVVRGVWATAEESLGGSSQADSVADAVPAPERPAQVDGTGLRQEAGAAEATGSPCAVERVVHVTAARANLRAAPEMRAAVLAELPEGTALRVCLSESTDAGWLPVLEDGALRRAAFIHRNVVR
jgi:hypothetical protein